jgi:hypothetical protein
MDSRKPPLPFQPIPLPDQSLRDCWQRTFVPPLVKQRLVRHLDIGYRLSSQSTATVGLALRRSVLLLGEPGRGTSSLAVGAPTEWDGHRCISVHLVRIHTHALPSGERGGTQRNVLRLFEGLGELASPD